MKLYITGPSHLLPRDRLRQCSAALMDYSVGPGRHLLRSNRARIIPGALLVITDESYNPGDYSNLVRELARECSLKNLRGVVADFEKDADYSGLLTALGAKLRQQSMELYLPERFAAVEGSFILVSTAISGGSLSQRLDELCRKYGAERLALDVERLCMDFLLPSPTGVGTTIDNRELDGLLKKRGAQPFFSIDLCAYYFTYSENGQHHFILYDTASSIKKKLAVGVSKGITRGFLMYGEVADILEDIL